MFIFHRRSLHAGLFVACWVLAGGLACEGQLADSNDRNLVIERAVYNALQRPINLDFRGMQLSAAVRAIGQSCGVNFMIDHKSLDEAGIAEDTELQATILGSTADAALAALLRQMELTWIVDDGQAMVTTMAYAETVLELRVYPVYDLVIAHDSKGSYADFDSLIDVVTSTVAPTTWSEVGGAGSIKPFFNSQSLVIKQTREVQREVEVLLAGLRRARDIQGLGQPAGGTPRATASYAPPAAAPLPVRAMPTISQPAISQPAAASPASRLVRVYE